MRVAILFEYPTLWGGERSMLAVLNELDRREVDVVAIAPGEGSLADTLRHQEIRHVPFQAFAADGTRRPREEVVPELQSVVDSVRPDIVHANSLSMCVLTGLLDPSCVRLGHLRDIIKLSKNVIRLLNQNDQLIAVSSATRGFHVEQGLSANKTEVIYNGVDCEVFKPRPDRGTIREELVLGPDASLSLTIGQIGLRKGLDVLIRAICTAAPLSPNLHLLVAGQRTSSKRESVEFEQRLHSEIGAAGLADRVHWLGYRDDIPTLMNESTFLVHTANQEPLGRVLLEAAASGLPIIATRVGGTEEILQHRRSAWLAEKGDHTSIANAMVDLANDRNSGIRAQFAVEARRRIESSFTIGAASSSLVALWRKLVVV